MRKAFLELGRIVGTHGIRGEIRVNPYCDGPEFAGQFRTVYFDDKGTSPAEVLACRAHGNVILMKLRDVQSIEDAEKLRNRLLYIKRDDASLAENTWFIEELVGCSVVDADTGAVYGTLAAVDKYPANDVWTIRADDGAEYLLPAIKDVIAGVDVDSGVVSIRPMKGIFESVNGDE